MHPQIAVLVKQELKKLLDVGFIRPIDYADWISNIMLALCEPAWALCKTGMKT